MNAIEQVLTKYNKPLFILLFVLCLMPFISPAIALFLGLALGQPDNPSRNSVRKRLNIYCSSL